MKRILMFDTSHGTQNMGDFIINSAINNEMDYLLKDNFVVRYGTHNPILRLTQNIKYSRIKDYCKNADYKFLCGTNIVHTNLNHLTPGFNINIYDSNNYKNVILLGCGIGGPNKKMDFRTKHIYKRILSKKYIHSTRDERTKRLIESLGFKAINTGCPTLWIFDKDFCKSIPHEKSTRVVFTLTDYCKNKKKDQEMINILRKNYKEVYYWVQGSGDLEYFNSFENIEGVKIVSPNLESYESLLDVGNVDYVGTRLHAGIFAMRHKIRSIILIVDDRARDMKETYNLVAVERDDIDKLDSMINSSFKTDIRIDEKKIAKWKAQFK